MDRERTETRPFVQAELDKAFAETALAADEYNRALRCYLDARKRLHEEQNEQIRGSDGSVRFPFSAAYNERDRTRGTLNMAGERLQAARENEARLRAARDEAST